jgi:arsenite transporter
MTQTKSPGVSGPAAVRTPPASVSWLSGLGKKLVILIPAAMAAGLLVGAFVDTRALAGMVVPLTMLMVYPMLIGFKPKDALSLADRKPVGLAMVLNFLVLPLIAFALARLFFADDAGLYVGMILAGLFPTSGMTISWTGFAKGNVRAAVQMTVIGLILASTLAPLYLFGLAGAVVEVDLLSVLTTVLLIVGLPMLAGSLTRIGIVRARGMAEFARLQPAFQGLSTLGVLAIVFVAMALKAPMIIAHPALLAWVLVPVVIFYALNYLIAIVAGRALLPVVTPSPSSTAR